MTEDQLRKLLSDRGAIITGSHVVYTKGDHGSAYVNKDVLSEDPRDVSAVCEGVASYIIRYCCANHISEQEIAIVSPAVGGVALSQWTTWHCLVYGLKARAYYADKADEGFVVKRGYDAKLKGKRVFVVEDVLNTGGSAAETVKAVRAVGGEVVMVLALCNRGGVTAEALGVPLLASLVEVTLDKYPPDNCPLCQQGIPINTSVGHGKQFLAAQNAIRAAVEPS